MLSDSDRRLSEIILKPYDFGSPLSVQRVFQYLQEFDTDSIPWYQEVTVMAHIANVALFSAQIAERINSVHPGSVDIHRVWLMGWLRDIGRVSWGHAVKNGLSDITEKYVHHGHLGYDLLVASGVPADLAVISMTHIGGGVSRNQVKEINQRLGRGVLPEQDWYATTIEEQIVAVADKVPGWNNTVKAPYAKFQASAGAEGKIYGEYPGSQGPIWERFWKFKKELDHLAGVDVLTLFDQGLFDSRSEAYKRLPKPDEISRMEY